MQRAVEQSLLCCADCLQTWNNVFFMCATMFWLKNARAAVWLDGRAPGTSLKPQLRTLS